MKTPVGKTKTVGFQFGIRKTFPVSADCIWTFLFSDLGLQIWLGKLKSELEIKKQYTTESGIEGLVRVFKPNSHIRLNWKLPDWDNLSTVQLRVIENGSKTTIAFHQENLKNSAQREAMNEHWNKVMAKITGALSEIIC